MYNELTNEAKKQMKTKYENTVKGKNLTVTLNRLFIEGLVLVACFVIISVAILVADLSNWYWVLAILSIIFGVIFLVGQHIIRSKEYNRFLKQLPKTEKNKLTKSK